MTIPNDTTLEQMLDGSDPTMRRVVSDLERVCTTLMTDDRRDAIANRLAAASAATPPRRPLSLPRIRLSRPVSIVSAAAVLLSLVLGYARLQSPTPVSAAQILRRGAAAIADVPAGSVVHEITQIHVTLLASPTNIPRPNDDVTMEQWTQVDAHGGPLQFDLQATSPNADLDERTLGEADGTMWIYGAKPDVVTKSTWTPGKSPFGAPSGNQAESLLFLPKDMMYKPQDPAAMRALLAAAASDTGGQLRLLPQQTIGGRTMDVVQLTQTVDTAGQQPGTQDVLTIYLDAAGYLVRRIDWHTVVPGHTIQLHGSQGEIPLVSDQTFDVTTYQVVPLSQVPAGTFTFTPAPGTKVCTPAAYTGPGGTMDCSIVGSSH
ncbi:MAG TPA: hypothetical protein VFB58_18790 [Chloroflexota bacterium]|nr:hypothetical protein [Chloroflexota bacterium]